MNLKEKLIKSLGGFGMILYFILSIAMFIFPVIMIILSFDLPIWVTFILTAILFFIPTIDYIYWIVGLVGTIIGPQDIIAYIYYICFAIIVFFFIIPDIIMLFKRD